MYCRTKNVCESVWQELASIGVSCDLYHGGLSMERRKNVHHRFIRDELQVCHKSIEYICDMEYGV